MRLTVIGCSPAWPNPGGAQSGYLVEGPGRLLVDCGPGVLSRLRVLDGGWPRVDAILLSHLHLDHFADLVGWVWGTVHGASAGVAAPELWIAEGRRPDLEALDAAVSDPGSFGRVFTIREYPVGTPFRVAGFDVLALRVPHYEEPACGLRISDGESTLAFSADTGPGPVLAELARDADLFLCEATLAEGAVDAEPRGHLTASEAAEVSAAAGARRLLLTHRPTELSPPVGVEVARDGLALEL